MVLNKESTHPAAFLCEGCGSGQSIAYSLQHTHMCCLVKRPLSLYTL